MVSHHFGSEQGHTDPEKGRRDRRNGTTVTDKGVSWYHNMAVLRKEEDKNIDDKGDDNNNNNNDEKMGLLGTKLRHEDFLYREASVTNGISLQHNIMSQKIRSIYYGRFVEGLRVTN
jgi:hypothetical protein